MHDVCIILGWNYLECRLWVLLPDQISQLSEGSADPGGLGV
jgi:hypothetical protein